MLESLRIRAQPVVIRQPAELAEQTVSQANVFLKSRCAETAILFLHLPKPPTNPEAHEQYISSLNSLTSGLCPTLLVHGIRSVVTTNL